jgi:biopolymer transport protein ExbB/TolQ
MEAPIIAPDAHFSIAAVLENADPFVKAIMGLLVLCSVISWAIAFKKVIGLTLFRARLRRAMNDGEGASRGPLREQLLRAASEEAPESNETRFNYRARLGAALFAVIEPQLRDLEGGMPFLATVGSTAPFVGLLGTVWGIMNSFTAIAAMKDTSLSTVAPGIAEALFATALGLGAAIPAVVFYNAFNIALGRLTREARERAAKLAAQLADERVMARNVRDFAA